MNGLQPGERVVELGALAHSVTTTAGAVSTPLLLFLARQSGGHCFVGFLAGTVMGFLVGLLLARLFYADGAGKVRIVRAAPENLPVTLRAAVNSALCQTAAVLLCLGFAGRILSWPEAASAALGVNLLLAFVIAHLSLQ